jgi:outer membrane protein OmpA-like peptidoglycan-associated protein
MPEDNKQGSIHSSSDGGTVGNYPDPDPSDFLVAPATSSESNALKFNLFLAAFLCISDIRFKFDSSFVLPAVQIEMKAFLDLRNGDPQVKSSPISIFGHADPSFQGNFDPSDSDTAGPGDDYNKTLSGRRAISIYALLIRDSSLWDNLYKNHLGSDVWGEDSIRTMLSSTGQPAADDSTVVGIANNSGQRQQLFLKYMNSVCGDLKLDKSADFLARGAGSDLKGDVQGCSRFNPLLVFNSEDEASFKEAFANNDQPTLRGDRDVRNSVNRRVMILIFKKGTQVLPAKWPCPTYKEGVAGCKKRFFKKDSTGPDGDTRRSTHNPDADRKFELTRDTFACRFYQRISGEKSPCNSTTPPPPKCCCCVTSAQIENVQPFGAEGLVSPNTGSMLYNGHIFDFRIEMTFAAGSSGTSDCVMEWWEKTNIPAIPGHQPNTWTDMYALYSASPTLKPWVRRTIPCPGGGPTTVVIHDPPSLGNVPGRTITRTLEFRLVAKSGTACACGITSATATATQVLQMVDGSLVAAGTSFTIGPSSKTP